ncbi:hypothetical protein C497_04392 [Halalkalicoccus jeotgali B3]|uniref:Uncharacterized protein n=2 Tax=Halalkalicoccus jeotgali TaxID=413810 RepID=D8JA71_HALJB|nr:hypothetical protein HacjB3_06010 [Halalkalicoccus jeotgali B3]ELY39965.1 hypothetical protein C497_04392 [Halalkalicoccus jeotgali B3]
MAVLALALVAGAVWLVRRWPYAVLVVVGLVGAVHALAYGTAYLDAARVTSARETAIELAREGFLVAAAGLDAAFGTVRELIAAGLAVLDGTPMPAASTSVLEFVAFLLGAVVVSGLVAGAVLWIVHWADGTPLGAWLAGLGVVFGATGILWTWLPMGLAEMNAIYAVAIVAAILAGVVGAGYAISALTATDSPTIGPRKRIRADR